MRTAWLFAFPTTTILRPSRISPSSRKLSTLAMSKHLVVDPFCFRQFSENDASKSYKGTVFTQSIKEFEEIVNQRYKEEDLKDGYASFCKHIFIENDFTDARVNVLPISKDNEHLVRTQYQARNDKELPVLQRFIPLELIGGTEKLPVAKYIDLILYSREQIRKENESLGNDPGEETAPWGIVSIKTQDVDFELPMNPITIMRNCLGQEHGGSGVPLDRAAYQESVKYWKDNVVVS
eukprot:scaffold1669_cov129-Cylindrotheca_fusiformis.AAC.30